MTRSASPATAIPLVDLQAQRARLDGRIEAAVQRVLEHGQFIMGPEVAELEKRLAHYCAARHAIGCASGTDALLLALLASGVGAGDAVLVPSFTFPGTAEAAALLGATPVFVDILADTYNVDPASVTAGIEAAERAALRPRALIAVDLFGQPADYDALEPLCRDRGLLLVVDAAQSFGAEWRGRRAGAIGDVACTSFFPSKPLACYGDGGAVFTEDDDLDSAIRSLRVHGAGRDKYDTIRVGLNARLDTLQAAILLEKLTVFDLELAARQQIAARYTAALADVVTPPAMRPGATSAWAQYTVRVDRRNAVAAALADHHVATAIHYPMPLHQQPAYTGFPVAGPELPVSESVVARVLSLPMHPYLDEAAQDRVIAVLREACAT